ncbi:helix-turn-helix domain-containing protein [Frankia sp. R82]|uniref:helix-turn-helix transcriptional regulator n=1 Tax=Frankia sp. R82 TaxID=2950553 RepID=UPI002044C4AC|nr:helix-turn-helix domain-containing protein [Frankia sp. R82]MCM3884185.1 helix-turn-helix domain-containing protein [Frankia sp. R82]
MERLLKPCELAELLQVKAKTLENWRAMSPPQGPAFVKIGRVVRYRTLDVLEYIKARTVQTVVD